MCLQCLMDVVHRKLHMYNKLGMNISYFSFSFTHINYLRQKFLNLISKYAILNGLKKSNRS